MRRKKRTKSEREWQEKAIVFIKPFIEAALKVYEEPVRAGTPRGEPIGNSRKKFEAVLWMIFCPELSLNEIGKLARISPGVLRVWRTQEKFLEAVMKWGETFGIAFCDTVELMLSKLDSRVTKYHKDEKRIKKLERGSLLSADQNDPIGTLRFLFSIVRFYGVHVFPCSPLMSLIRKYPEPLWFIADRTLLAPSFEENLRNYWHRRPELKGLAKEMIEKNFNLLKNSKYWEKRSPEEFQEMIESLKGYTLGLVDELGK
jgi:hypothetical protein